MRNALFIGNGINLVSDEGASWTALLNELAGDPKTLHEEAVRKEKPFTLWFEELSRTSNTKKLKKRVAEVLEDGLTTNSIHTEIMNLNVENVLTTNYDYNLENASRDSWSLNMAAPESFYSLFRRRSQGIKNIWHVHGDGSPQADGSP